MLFKFLFKKKKKKKLQEQSEQKFDMNNWMNLSKEERLEIDFNEKNIIMRKKKALLKSIREEYLKIKNKEQKISKSQKNSKKVIY
ncbi:putative Hantavirus glycoprotein G2 [Prochlorococcus sp. MIT 0801]|nr:putative Hantavirus glycoprotein G2 [Prochlorococcus sp. MIT 0801]